MPNLNCRNAWHVKFWGECNDCLIPYTHRFFHTLKWWNQSEIHSKLILCLKMQFSWASKLQLLSFWYFQYKILYTHCSLLSYSITLICEKASRAETLPMNDWSTGMSCKHSWACKYMSRHIQCRYMAVQCGLSVINSVSVFVNRPHSRMCITVTLIYSRAVQRGARGRHGARDILSWRPTLLCRL
jgi:hypothetical protein